MLRTSLVALVFSGLLTPAFGGDMEAGSVLICDTQHQAERVASLLQTDAVDAVSVVSDVNAEEHSPTACGMADVTFLRGSTLATVRTGAQTFQIAKVLVMGVLTKTGVQDVAPQIYFSVTKIDERRA
jgi:hypothetical protein